MGKKLVLGIVLFCCVAFVGRSHAAILPDAPTQAKPILRTLSKWDIAADASVAVARTLDYTSTEAFLSPKPVQGGIGMRAPGHEILLPAAIADHPAALASFEAGTTILSAWGERYLMRHGHGRIARIGQFVQAGLVLGTAIDNYRLAAEPVSTVAVVPVHGRAR